MKLRHSGLALALSFAFAAAPAFAQRPTPPTHAAAAALYAADAQAIEAETLQALAANPGNPDAVANAAGAKMQALNTEFEDFDFDLQSALEGLPGYIDAQTAGKPARERDFRAEMIIEDQVAVGRTERVRGLMLAAIAARADLSETMAAAAQRVIDRN